jgi:hypothetical protein
VVRPVNEGDQGVGGGCDERLLHALVAGGPDGQFSHFFLHIRTSFASE